MKVIQVLAVFAVIMLGLGWGIFQTSKGSFGPLAVSLIVFAIAFAKFGCMPPEHH